MRLNFHGALQDLFGDSVTMEAASIAEALEGFSRQQPEWPRDMRVTVVGYESSDQLAECPVEVDVMPAMYGGGGKFGSIILGAAMIGLAFIPGINAIAVGLKAALLISGGLMMLQGVASLFMKSPTVSTKSDPDASKYLSVNKNTTAVGTPIPLAWGRVTLSGQWLSLQSDSSNLSHGVFPANPT